MAPRTTVCYNWPVIPLGMMYWISCSTVKFHIYIGVCVCVIETVLEYYKTNNNICLWNMGFERHYKKQVNGIWKETVKKDFWSYKRKRRYMEYQNKRGFRWINKTQVYNKSHKSTKIKLVWQFTTNAGRENGKKVFKWKPKLTRPLRRPKSGLEDDIRNGMRKLKIKNWTSSIQDRNKWKLYVERGKTFEDWSCSA